MYKSLIRLKLHIQRYFTPVKLTKRPVYRLVIDFFNNKLMFNLRCPILYLYINFSVFKFQRHDHEDPLMKIFPKVIKCTSKQLQTVLGRSAESTCVLPLNAVHQKIYAFIWFWYMMLMIVLSLLALFRVMTMYCPKVRAILLRLRNNILPRNIAENVVYQTDVCDWWVLYMLADNMDSHTHREVVQLFSRHLIQDIELIAL